MTIIQVVAITTLVVVSVACSSHELKVTPPSAASATTPVSNNGSAKNETREQAIRKIDFANFTYPWLSEFVDPQNPKKDLTICSGELEPIRDDKNMVIEMGASLESVVYGDVTRDGQDDAMVVLSIRTGAQAMPRALYVYQPNDQGAKLLWTVGFGDRENGGLRKVYADNSNLVIERYSPKDSKGACCPIYFNRQSYEWKGGKFRETGKLEVLPNTEGHSSPVMPRFEARP